MADALAHTACLDTVYGSLRCDMAKSLLELDSIGGINMRAAITGVLEGPDSCDKEM